MNDTETVARDQAARLHAAALIGLSDHIVEHRLVFLSVTAPTLTREPLEVFVGRDDWQRWLDTVEVDWTEDLRREPGLQATTWLVRLDASGLRLKLRAYRNDEDVTAYWHAHRPADLPACAEVGA